MSLPRAPRPMLRSLTLQKNARTTRSEFCRACFYSTESPSPAPPSLASRLLNSQTRTSTLFAALIAIGIGATTYGLYEFYTSLTMWPPELRGDLRAGIKARNAGDYKTSTQFLHRAWETARTSPHSKLPGDAHLAISGIAITLAGVLEKAEDPRGAYSVYENAWRDIVDSASSNENGKIASAARRRALALAHKLADLAEQQNLPAEEEERWRVWAVEEVLRDRADVQKQKEKVASGSESVDFGLGVDNKEWATGEDVAAIVQALGAFYARVGNVDYAIPLYLHALSVLIPPSTTGKDSTKSVVDRVPVEDRCKGAELMNNLADLILLTNTPPHTPSRSPSAQPRAPPLPPPPEKIRQAEAWAQRAVDVAHRVLSTASPMAISVADDGVGRCGAVLTVALCNLGHLRELAGDPADARERYEEALRWADVMRFQEGVVEAQRGIRRVERKMKGGKPPEES